MQKRSSKNRRTQTDINVTAARIISEATSTDIPRTSEGKNAYAIALGRRGGLKGGRTRAEKLTSERRVEIARRAARVRWGK